MHASATPAPPFPACSKAEMERTDLAQQVRTHFQFVWRTLRRFGLLPADADDAAQQVFLVFAAKLNTIELGSERAFLFGTAVRIASRARRTRQRRRENLEDTFDALLAGGHDPEQALAQREASELLNAILDTMPDELRAAFVLYEVEQLTMVEIGEMLQVPQGTVASRLRRAREQYDAAVSRVQKRMSHNRGAQ